MERQDSFTLVELLVVMSIIGILVVLVAPTAATIIGGSKITQAADMIVGSLTQARQTALTKDRSVEVRLYQYGDPEVPGESASNPGAGKFRALQIFEIDDAGKSSPLSKIQQLPTSTIVDAGRANANQSLSSILASAQGSPAVPTSATGAALGVSIPKVGTQYNCVMFRFRRDGSTNLPLTSAAWFVTTHDAKYGDKMAAPPANFATVQIDPLNGATKTFRP